MNNGWYRITRPNGGEQMVLQVYRNNTSEGSVYSLLNQFCTFEPVEIFNQQELERYVNEELTKRMARDNG